MYTLYRLQEGTRLVDFHLPYDIIKTILFFFY